MTRVSLVVTPPRHALRGAVVTPLSLRERRSYTPITPPRHSNDTFHTRLFWGAKKTTQNHRHWVASDSKDEMYIPDGPKQGRNYLRT